MTGLAIRADGGKNPDVLVSSVRDANGTLLFTTEPQPLAQNDHQCCRMVRRHQELQPFLVKVE